jgi:hypothetical protein
MGRNHSEDDDGKSQLTSAANLLDVKVTGESR